MITASGLGRFIIVVFLLGVSVLPAVGETIKCKPRFPVYCGNIHVACSGRTSLPTSGFVATVIGEAAQVIFEDGKSWMAVATPQNGEWVIRKLDSGDWIRIDRENRFSQRIYHKGNALMALGKCQRD